VPNPQLDSELVEKKGRGGGFGGVGATEVDLSSKEKERGGEWPTTTFRIEREGKRRASLISGYSRMSWVSEGGGSGQLNPLRYRLGTVWPGPPFFFFFFLPEAGEGVVCATKRREETKSPAQRGPRASLMWEGSGEGGVGLQPVTWEEREENKERERRQIPSAMPARSQKREEEKGLFESRP